MAITLSTSAAVTPYLYGIGDTRNGIKVLTLQETGFTETPIPLNSQFIVEPGQLVNPYGVVPITINGYIVTFITPGWNYRSRVSVRPTFVPKTQIFVDYTGLSTLMDAYEFFNTVYDEGTSTNVIVNGVMKVTAYGESSWGKVTNYGAPKDYLVSCSGGFIAKREEFTAPAWTPNPGSVINGIQVGSKIQFFTEDQFSLILFDDISTIRYNLNSTPDL